MNAAEQQNTIHGDIYGAVQKDAVKKDDKFRGQKLLNRFASSVAEYSARRFVDNSLITLAKLASNIVGLPAFKEPWMMLSIIASSFVAARMELELTYCGSCSVWYEKVLPKAHAVAVAKAYQIFEELRPAVYFAT